MKKTLLALLLGCSTLASADETGDKKENATAADATQETASGRSAQETTPGRSTQETAPSRSTQEIIDTAPADAWRTPDPAQLLYLNTVKGTVVFELAPDFAPEHVAQIKLLAGKHFWDDTHIYRVQDNYVVQFGDANAEDKEKAKPLPTEIKALPDEYSRPVTGLDFKPIPDKDGWAEQVGFVNGFPVGREGDEAWLTHCYGALGVGRNDPPDNGNGSELYVVIGQSPRYLDRNIALVGRVIHGAGVLSSLPRGTNNNAGYAGYYNSPDEFTPVQSVRLGSEVPEGERLPLQVMKTDSPAFAELVESRRNRSGDWFKRRANYTDICNIDIPSRLQK